MEAHAHEPENLEVKVVRPLRSRTWVKLIVIFLVGILAGYGLFRSLENGAKLPAASSPDPPASAATVLKGDSMTASDLLHFETPLIKASCIVKYSRTMIEVRVDLSSLYPVKALVEFDVNNMTVLEVRNKSVNDQSTSMAASEFVQFNSVGDNKYVILLANKNTLPHQLEFKLSQNDSPIYQGVARINRD